MGFTDVYTWFANAERVHPVKGAWQHRHDL
jgi:hypothetical protein